MSTRGRAVQNLKTTLEEGNGNDRDESTEIDLEKIRE